MEMESTHGLLMDRVWDVLRPDLVLTPYRRTRAWQAKDVEALWDSLLNGRSIGELMTWQPDELSVIGSNRRQELLLLDGQNRLTALALSIIHPHSQRPDLMRTDESMFEIWSSGQHIVLDFETKSARFVPYGESDTPNRIPVFALTSDYQVQETFRELAARHGEGENFTNFRNWVSDIENQLNTARIEVTQVTGGSPQDVAAAYEAYAIVRDVVPAASPAP